MKTLDYTWITTICDTPLDCSRKLLLLQQAIIELNPELLECYFFVQLSPTNKAPIQANCLF